MRRLPTARVRSSFISNKWQATKSSCAPARVWRDSKSLQLTGQVMMGGNSGVFCCVRLGLAIPISPHVVRFSTGCTDCDFQVLEMFPFAKGA
jgi:hypothetical protein